MFYFPIQKALVREGFFIKDKRLLDGLSRIYITRIGPAQTFT